VATSTGRSVEAGLSTTLRSGRDDKVGVERRVQQIPFGNDRKKSKSSNSALPDHAEALGILQLAPKIQKTIY
jgi:hypothetical protein